MVTVLEFILIARDRLMYYSNLAEHTGLMYVSLLGMEDSKNECMYIITWKVKYSASPLTLFYS